MIAAKLFGELMTRAMAAGRLPDVVLYGALKAITEDAFRTLPAGVAVGLFEALSRNETTAPRARAALALCASLKVAPIDAEAFLFFGAGLWNMAARMVLDAVKREPSAATRAMLIEIVDGLLQDSVALLVDVVNAVPTIAVQDAVSTDVSLDVAGATVAGDEHRRAMLRTRRLALADAIEDFVNMCESGAKHFASRAPFYDRIVPAFDELIDVEPDVDAVPEISAERNGFGALSNRIRRGIAAKYRALANAT